ncbi:MAG TPA: hypothetical protein VMU06_22390 [Stellaceae bacterium]|nr:hypothetical protein [Stellaceae bacterium]
MGRADLGITGTRFRLFPRPPYIHPERPPEIIPVTTIPGQIGRGPSDDRLYVIAPIGKRRPYGINRGPYGTPHLDLPPWRGPVRRPAEPDPHGHFDHIPADAPEFAAAHVFGAIRFTLEIWERYFGHAIPWHFARDFDRLEVSILPGHDNAHAGYGFMEVGEHLTTDGTAVPYALNFDVIAHELGHLIIYSMLGVPTAATAQGEYFGFHEAAADVTALVASLHFDSLVDHLLEDTSGNLYTYNELDRFAELSATEQIRLASNSLKMSRFAAGWEDEHELSQPLTGALFDIFVDIFQENLIERGVIGRTVAELNDLVRNRPEYAATIQPIFDAAYSDQRSEFRAALIDARDYAGVALAETWKRLSPHYLDYQEIANTLLAVDRVLTGGRYRRAMVDSFAWREIGKVQVGPRLKPPGKSSHAYSARTMLPELERRLPRMSYREQAVVLRGRA